MSRAKINSTEAEINSASTIYRWSAMGVQTAGKRNNRFIYSKKIRDFFATGAQLIGEILWSNVTTQSKFANKTMI